MRLKKKPDNEFQGFSVPAVPRGPRSVRKWCHQKKNNDGQICAFELLASLAGKLLRETANSASSNGSKAYNWIDKDHIKQENPSKLDAIDSDPPHINKACDDSKEITSNIPNEIEKLQRAKGRAGFYAKSVAAVNSGRTIVPLLRRNTSPNSSFNSCRKKLQSRIADRRIRKLLTSKYWKVAPKSRDGGSVRPVRKPFYQKRKSNYKHGRYYCRTLLQRRRFSDHCSAMTFDGGISSDSVSNFPGKNINVYGGPSSVLNHEPSSQSEGSRVKFRIKSFKVPELLIEVPENATVGSLKRTVMEAVTAILGGELRVGVIHHGKKVKDDSRTLLQTGISCKDNVDMLNFTLESNRMPARSTPLLACDTSNLLTRSPENPAVDQEVSDDQLAAPATKCIDQDENNHELMSMLTVEEASPDCKALAVVPDFILDAIAVIPANQKNKISDPVQRRTRRPFSVSEVESLVQAVEDLGTGRWRDIKLRAFEDADHRTYVDLKDKWKTLVHTARIGPRQRRGEPVPQELLNRVLAAHAYWSYCQAKHQGPAASLQAAMEMEAESLIEGEPICIDVQKA